VSEISTVHASSRFEQSASAQKQQSQQQSMEQSMKQQSKEHNYGEQCTHLNFNLANRIDPRMMKPYFD